MAKYSHEFKLEVVNHYLSGNDGYKRTGRLFNLNESIVHKWASIYKTHGEVGLRPSVSYQVYSADFKLSVIEAIINNGLSYSEALVRFHLKEMGMISKWMRHYQEHGIDGLKPKPRGRSKIMPKPKITKSKLGLADKDKTNKELLEELAYLRAENAFLKKLRALRLEQEADDAAEQQRLQTLYQD